MYYEHIQQALDKVQATLSKEELEELLQENQSYLCSEFRPRFSNWFEDTLDTLDDDSIEAIITTVDELIDPKHQFRLEQEMVAIGDVCFPKPESSPLRTGTTYFYPNFIKVGLEDWFEWTDDELDFKLLKSNMLHLSKENAIAHAKALIKLNGGKIDE